MIANRRRQYYIDRLFQRRFIILFLMMTLLITLGNALFYLGYLEPMLSGLMYRSHIPLENPASLLMERLVVVTLGILTGIVLLSTAFYSVMRIRLQVFLAWLNHAVADAIRGEANRSWVCPGEEFQDLSTTLTAFFQQVSDQRVGRNLFATGLCEAVRAGRENELAHLLEAKRKDLD